jgi:hypothetical protein
VIRWKRCTILPHSLKLSCTHFPISISVSISIVNQSLRQNTFKSRAVYYTIYTFFQHTEERDVALTVRTQYVHRTLRLFSYSSDPGVATERIAQRSVAHLVRSVLQLHALPFFCDTHNYPYSSSVSAFSRHFSFRPCYGHNIDIRLLSQFFSK